jgi:hypothetical protein
MSDGTCAYATETLVVNTTAKMTEITTSSQRAAMPIQCGRLMIAAHMLRRCTQKILAAWLSLRRVSQWIAL